MTQGVLTPSVTGNATRFDIGGTPRRTPMCCGLTPVIGQFSTQGLPDTDHSLLPTVHNLFYDADFYVTDASGTQVLEFDISMYMNGAGMIWGNQCNNLGDKDWGYLGQRQRQVGFGGRALQPDRQGMEPRDDSGAARGR